MNKPHTYFFFFKEIFCAFLNTILKPNTPDTGVQYQCRGSCVLYVVRRQSGFGYWECGWVCSLAQQAFRPRTDPESFTAVIILFINYKKGAVELGYCKALLNVAPGSTYFFRTTLRFFTKVLCVGIHCVTRLASFK